MTSSVYNFTFDNLSRIGFYKLLEQSLKEKCKIKTLEHIHSKVSFYPIVV